MSRQVWATIQLQLLTGAQAGELTRLHPCDIDLPAGQAGRGGGGLPAVAQGVAEGRRRVWVYRLAEHKTSWHGRDKRAFIGPRAQEVLAPFLLRDPKAYCFSPPEAMEEWRCQDHRTVTAFGNRTTPLSCGNAGDTNRKDKPKWTPGERYTTHTCRRAITRGCDRAFPSPAPLAREEDETVARWQKRLTKAQKADLAASRRAHHWHPHQLRHNAATDLRKEFGIESARIILGHRSAAITEVYAEKDGRQAINAMMEVG